MIYSNEERQDILLLYAKNNYNASSTVRDYRQQYPERQCPARATIIRLHRKFRETSSVRRKKRTVPANEEMDLNILLHYQENPRTSIRKVCQILRQRGFQNRSSFGKVRKELNKQSYKPYKMHITQPLSDEQKRKRVEFCQHMLQRINEDPQFLHKILWSDESSFSTSGVPNRQNHRFWATENPNFIKEVRVQGRQTLNVWCGILGDRIVGPYIFERTLTGEIYVNFLETYLTDFLDSLPLNQLQGLIFHQDGAPPHNTRGSRDFLNNNFGEWIGKFGNIRWPPSSFDLTPLDIFLWPYIKDKVYLADIQNREQMRELVELELNRLVENFPEFLINSINGLRNRFEKCIQVNGDRFEHLL